MRKQPNRNVRIASTGDNTGGIKIIQGGSFLNNDQEIIQYKSLFMKELARENIIDSSVVTILDSIPNEVYEPIVIHADSEPSMDDAYVLANAIVARATMYALIKVTKSLILDIINTLEGNKWWLNKLLYLERIEET